MYDKKEIKKILSRAFELQNRTEGTPLDRSVEHRLSLEDVEQIARESGLSAEYVRQAALEFEGIPVEEPLFLTTGNTYEVELIGFAKGELDKKTWAELRAVIEYHFDSPGKVKRRPNGMVWKAQPQGILKFLHTRKSPVVEVSTKGNKTTILLKKSLKTIHRLLYPAYAALAGAMVILGISMMEGPEGLFFSAGLLVVAKLFHAWTNSKKEKDRDVLKEFMEQLQTIVTRRYTAAEEKSLKTRSEKSAKRITLPEEEEEISQKEAPTSGRQKTAG